MTAGPLVLETQDFAAAARRLRLWVAEPIETRTTALSRVLDGCAGMAGSDAGGMAWAASYDRAAAGASRAAADAAVAVDNLAGMFAQTARNYARAEAASTASERALIDHAVEDLPAFSRRYGLPVCVPPPAGGGSAGGPSGWGLISAAVGYVWPNGHQDRLRAAAAAWSAAAHALRCGADETGPAAAAALDDRLPEAADIWRVCDSAAHRLRELADLHQAIADSCAALAHHLDEVHSAVEGELSSLVAWTAGIEATGGFLSLLTLGVAEAPTQAVEAGRVAATAARVAALIERFTSTVRTLTAPLASIAERIDRLAAELVGLRDMRLTSAVVTQVQLMPSALRISEMLAVRRLGVTAGELPQITVSAKQMEMKFKHAAAFGITLPRSRAAFEEFEHAVRRFVTDAGSTTIRATYRGRDVFATYTTKERLVVVRDLRGQFISGWRMRRIQLLHLVRDRRLGGG